MEDGDGVPRGAMGDVIVMWGHGLLSLWRAEGCSHHGDVGLWEGHEDTFVVGGLEGTWGLWGVQSSWGALVNLRG